MYYIYGAIVGNPIYTTPPPFKKPPPPFWVPPFYRKSYPPFCGFTRSPEAGVFVGGSNQELRLYEGSNYVGFEAPALSANQIWVLPAADASTSGDTLTSNASGTLSWTTPSAGVGLGLVIALG